MYGCLLLSQLGTWPATQACAPTGNRTRKPLIHRQALNPLSYTSQCQKCISYPNDAYCGLSTTLLYSLFILGPRLMEKPSLECGSRRQKEGNMGEACSGSQSIWGKGLVSFRSTPVDQNKSQGHRKDHMRRGLGPVERGCEYFDKNIICYRVSNALCETPAV